jgi:hypothetical protein
MQPLHTATIIVFLRPIFIGIGFNESTKGGSKKLPPWHTKTKTVFLLKLLESVFF